MAEPTQRATSPRKPEARTEKVESLVDLVRRGIVRVPHFQRGLNWGGDEVRMLFDSIYRGYPVGSLLFYKRPAPAGRISVGPLVVDAPESAEAWWVVDGQQRITSLAACLGRPTPLPVPPERPDPYVLFFDPRELSFHSHPHQEEIPSHWVPLPFLLDATRLAEWIFGWPHGQDETLRRTVFDAGTRIREYPIPLYLLDAEEERAKEIFFRINMAGKALAWHEVHTALFGGDGVIPSTLDELADELEGVGLGRLDEGRLLTTLVGLRGEDPTRTLPELVQRDREILSGAVQEALPVLRRVLSFLRHDAGVLHLRLLPKSILLDVLTRFFALHPEPNPRTRRLLSRWFWRTVLGTGAYDDRTVRRSGIKAVGDDEEASVQALLALLRKERPRGIELPVKFDPRADLSRITLLTLAGLVPRDVRSGDPLDVSALLEGEGTPVVRILDVPGLGGSQSPANRILHPRSGAVRQALVERFRGWGAGDPVLASHAISPEAAACLASGDHAGFLAVRTRDLTGEVSLFAERRAEWDHTDRPSLDYLLAAAGVEP